MAERSAYIMRPAVACEISPRAVVAARRTTTSIENVHTRSLPAGAVTPSLLAQNIANPGAVRDAISAVIDAVGRSRDVVAVIPDAAARVVLLDFDSFPSRSQEAEQVVRFRLKKSLPFDADKAAISYDVIREGNVARVIAAVILHTVLEEYEAVFRDAGLEPGVVLPSTLASLGAVDAAHPTMLIKADDVTTSVAIVDNGRLLLYRTSESGNVSLTPERLADDVYPSIVYLQDTYGMNVDRVLLAGVQNPGDYASLLAQQTGARVEDLSTATSARVAADAAGAVGALL